MIKTSVTNFRKNIFGILEQTIKFNEPVNISTKTGNAVVLSEDDYNGWMETLRIYSNPKETEKIIYCLNTKLEDCVSEDEVEW